MIPEETFSPIIAVLALTAVALCVLVIVLAELPGQENLRAFIHGHAQKPMLAVAAVAMLSSLYYSDYAHFTPCELCWYQRIAMYPLVFLIGTALVTRTRLDPRYILVIAGIGLGISIYHYQIELFPNQAQVCSGGVVSCSVRFVEEMGFISIPFMAGCGFLSILLLQFAEWRSGRLLAAEEEPVRGPARKAATS
ncbi:MAG: disulfide bond formation protein B [Dehalococcoidia bacterium]|nr:disulfide bond formation protein B [Dehalococcoidia bacterium]